MPFFVLIRSRILSFCSSVSFARLVKQETESESKYFISDFFIENIITSPSTSSPLSSFLISQAKYRAAKGLLEISRSRVGNE